jgi:hypothetical protein
MRPNPGAHFGHLAGFQLAYRQSGNSSKIGEAATPLTNVLHNAACPPSLPTPKKECYPSAFRAIYEEAGVKKGILLAIGGLLLLAGCNNQGNKGGIPIEPKWKGAPYRIAFDTKAAKPSPTGVDIPPVKFTANPDALETRAVLVLKFSAPSAPKQEATDHMMIGSALDIHGSEGTIPDDYMERARKGLSDYLETYCVKGKVDLSVALARSSLNPQAGIDQVDPKRLSDWLPLEITYKPKHSKCK